MEVIRSHGPRSCQLRNWHDAQRTNSRNNARSFRNGHHKMRWVGITSGTDVCTQSNVLSYNVKFLFLPKSWSWCPRAWNKRLANNIYSTQFCTVYLQIPETTCNYIMQVNVKWKSNSLTSVEHGLIVCGDVQRCTNIVRAITKEIGCSTTSIYHHPSGCRSLVLFRRGSEEGEGSC